MKLSSRKTEHERKIELSMTSMIDVVFLLLIFFMTTSSFVKTERNLDSAIKDKEQRAQPAPSDLEPAVVEVVRSDARFVYRVGTRELTSERELTELLRQFKNKSDGAFVRVSDAAPFRMAAAAIQSCKNAQFTAVAYVPMD
ncbi:MAG: ExbD/TolR family protein [Pirellulaceae bacterium]